VDLADVEARFPTDDDCLALLERVRWGATPVCPYCGSSRSTRLTRERRHRCNGCATAFSVTVNTPLHHTRLPLQKWLLAVALALDPAENLTTRRLAQALQVNKNTAWYVADRIRNGLLDPLQRRLLSDIGSALTPTESETP
jgi:transposase-like protein